MLAGLPAPTRPGISNNFDSLPRRQDYNDKFDVKVDQQFGSATSAFVRFSHRKVNNFEPPPIPGETSSPSNAFVEVLNQQLALGVTRTLSSRSLLEVRFGVSRTEAGKTALGTGTPEHARGATASPGLPTDAVFSGGLTQQSVTGWTAWGRQSSNPQFQNPFVLDARLNYSWIAGTHTLKTGYEYQRSTPTSTTCIRSTARIPTAGSSAGRPARPPIRRPTTSPTSCSGARSTYELVNPFVFHLRQRMHFGYLQDDWRVVAGADREPGPALRVRDAAVGGRQLPDQLRSGDATRCCRRVTARSTIARSSTRIATTSRRASAWPTASTTKTVLRSAYGTSYVHFNRLGGENLLSFNGPHVVPITITQQPSQGLCAREPGADAPASARRRRAIRRA